MPVGAPGSRSSRRRKHSRVTRPRWECGGHCAGASSSNAGPGPRSASPSPRCAKAATTARKRRSETRCSGVLLGASGGATATSVSAPASFAWPASSCRRQWPARSGAAAGRLPRSSKRPGRASDVSGRRMPSADSRVMPAASTICWPRRSRATLAPESWQPHSSTQARRLNSFTAARRSARRSNSWAARPASSRRARCRPPRP
mmetsp:Transcript_24387/g.75943  ORF Transcript_24387/g.75943 Transcript_24387/m.75943 type:complete len:203 (-) Transcript_24387:164-772(-)